MWPDTYDVGRLTSAAALAAELHQRQLRKGTRVPYLSHLLGVASLVLEDEGTEDEVIASLLHDAAEDQGGEATLSRLRADFGETVAELVRQCSDSILEAGQEKAPWRKRKEAAIAHLAEMSEGALRVTAADKLHNTRSTLADRALVGDAVWSRSRRVARVSCGTTTRS